ncbi:helix-turn-helix domain-containing protein [Paenibacillus azoreducens]|uniref:HTH cro/C1-type domain-containing protein n=1 Tax=Paenibacillus azoreducens TaxID=116718 RepID=A0A920CT47_9BACL|nr:helix-turn-helix transcriptional regulator [Paenibacillus azoreducens]GIO48027.1 hypothetical protein J34TS1_27920 [Paenibacillus azoreducens]
MIDFGKLKTLRTQKKIPLQEMADALGFQTAGGYLRIESGENKLKAEHLPVLADKFEMSLNQLIGEIFFGSQLDESSIKKEIVDTPSIKQEVI